MPVERQRWKPAESLDALNAQLRRVVEVFDNAFRYHVIRITATGRLTLTYPLSLVLIDTTSGNVTLTLPDAQTVAGYRIDAKKLVAANSITIDTTGSDTIDGASSFSWSTRYQSFSIVNDGGTWHVV
jgi:hypothetical protein